MSKFSEAATVAQIAAPAGYSCVGGPFGSDLTAKDYTERGVPVIRGSNLSGVGHWMSESEFVFVSEAKADALRRNMAFPGDIVFTQRGSLGQVARIRPDARAPRYLLSQSQMKLTVDLAKADPDFVCHYFRSEEGQRQILRATTATGVPHINLGSLKSFSLPLPPLKEQREIAATLQASDDAIAADEAVVEQLNRVRRELAEDLLRHGLPNRHRSVQRSDVVSFPASWRAAPTGEVVAGCDYGLSCAMGLDSTGVPCLRMGNIQGGEVRLDDLKYVTAGEAEPRLLLNVGDVLFNRTNSKDLVGKVGVFRGWPEPVTFASYLLRLRPQPEVAGGDWVGLVLSTEPYQRYIRNMATPGISQVNVNRTKLLEIPLRYRPSLSEQRTIVDTVGAVTERIERERAVVAQRRPLKAALADGLLTGKIRVAGGKGV